jgi:regulator of sigma E protease
MAAISLSLGIFNLLPVPALDGGRILILVIEGIRRKPLKESVEQAIILIGFVAILVFAIIITVSDVIKIF